MIEGTDKDGGKSEIQIKDKADFRVHKINNSLRDEVGISKTILSTDKEVMRSEKEVYPMRDFSKPCNQDESTLMVNSPISKGTYDIGDQDTFIIQTEGVYPSQDARRELTEVDSQVEAMVINLKTDSIMPMP